MQEDVKCLAILDNVLAFPGFAWMLERLILVLLSYNKNIKTTGFKAAIRTYYDSICNVCNPKFTDEVTKEIGTHNIIWDKS
jgi:hypothetical protein